MTTQEIEAALRENKTQIQARPRASGRQFVIRYEPGTTYVGSDLVETDNAHIARDLINSLSKGENVVMPNHFELIVIQEET